VSGHVDSDSVYAGNPAKKLMTLDEFRVKREKKQLEEAKNVVLEYKRRFNKMPPESELDEYFFLFRKDDNLSAFKEKMELMWNYNVSKKNIQTHKTRFKDYQDFLNYCLKEE
jgi:maltose O-acetyltransferase